MARIIGHLAKFKRNGAWDAQRVGGTFHEEFVAYSTVAIVLPASAAGISKDVRLDLKNKFAYIFSRYKNTTKFDEKYNYLPDKNIINTEIGYDLFESKKIK